MAKKINRDAARRKYRAQYGTAPSSDAALTTFIANMSTSDRSSRPRTAQ